MHFMMEFISIKLLKQIGEALFISPQTVRTHIRNIYEKLQVKSKIEAVNKIFKRE